jgi:DNA-binding GntR family transcriptional regulator
MASKRNLKKDIRSITALVIADALEHASRFDNEDQEKVLDIIVSITQTHNDLIARVNHPDGKENHKLMRKHYRKIIDDLMNSYNNAYQKLGAMA